MVLRTCFQDKKYLLKKFINDKADIFASSVNCLGDFHCLKFFLDMSTICSSNSFFFYQI